MVNENERGCFDRSLEANLPALRACRLRRDENVQEHEAEVQVRLKGYSEERGPQAGVADNESAGAISNEAISCQC